MVARPMVAAWLIVGRPARTRSAIETAATEIESTQPNARRADRCGLMTAPRQILTGQFYFITRRTLLRMHLLRPSPEVNRMIEYCLAEAADRCDIQLITWCVMSNHYHAVVYDPDRNVLVFIERFHRMVAKVLNRHHGRFESFWSREQTCVVRLVTNADVLDKVVYTLTNPAAAHLVEDVGHWAGSSSWTRMGRPGKKLKRPSAYFCVDGSMPKEVELRANVPHGLDGARAEKWIQSVREAVIARQRTLAKERTRPVVGVKRVLAMNPTDSPRTDAPRWNLNPHLACKDRERMKLERKQLLEFRHKYREMLMRLRTGEGDIEFPDGTYRLRLLGLRCKACIEGTTSTRRKPPKKTRPSRASKAA